MHVPATSRSSKQHVLDAVLRLVARGGVAEASLRKVADESGINIGSVRHYFGNHEGVLVAAADEVGARMEHRLNALLPEAPTDLDLAGRRALVEAVCRAVLPLPEHDHAEGIVLTELIVAARLRLEFRPLTNRMGDDLRAVLRRALCVGGVADPETETERLTALVGGLTFELVYPHGADGADALVGVLRHHIAEAIPA